MWAAKCHLVGVEYCHTNDSVVDLSNRGGKKHSIELIHMIYVIQCEMCQWFCVKCGNFLQTLEMIIENWSVQLLEYQPT